MSQVTQSIRGWLLTSPDVMNSDFTEDTDLLGSGVLDSIGFLSLIEYLETEHSLTMDLELLGDQEDITTIRGLATYLESIRS